MAINVDTVYKTVLLILNNEQRGYMTPDEFNKIGSQVQRQIFEAYFEDLNQQLRIPQSDMEYSDRVAITDEKIAEFKTELNPTGTNPFTVPDNLYRLGSITYEPNASTYKEIQRVGRAEIYNIRKAPLTAPTTSYPIYLYEDNKALVYPEAIIDPAHIKMQYVKKPSEVRWGYYIGGLGQYINDPTIFTSSSLNNGGTLNLYSGLGTTGVVGSYNNLTYTGGSGTGLVINAVVTSTSEVTFTIANPGSDYVVGDQIVISAGELGTNSTAVTITLVESNFNIGSTYGSTNFELHNSERTEVILRILLYSGIVIRDPSIIQVAAQKIQQEEVNEKS